MQTPPNPHNHRPRALSLVFVIILGTLIMLTVGSIAAWQFNAIQQNKDLYLSTQAYYIARATLEQGIADASDNGIGYEGSGTDSDWDLNGDGVSDATGSYKIFSRAKPLDWDAASWDFASAIPACTGTGLCYVPIPGTGSAGGSIGEDCNFRDTDQSWYDEADDPCNWNRIAYGQTISIPFFYEDSFEADGVADPSDTLLSIFTLKVRTPIDDGTGFGATLQTSDDSDPDGDVVLNWQFTGECDEDGDTDGDGVLEYEMECYLTAVTDSFSVGPSTIEESLIHEFDVNEATAVGYEVLRNL